MFLGDALAAEAAAVLALWLWTFTSGAVFSTAYLLNHPLILFGLMPSWLLLLSPDYFGYRLPSAWPATVRRLLQAGGLTLGVYLGLFFLNSRGQLPRLVILYFSTGAFAFGLGWRQIYLTLFTSHIFCRQVVVVGAGWAGQTIVDALAKSQPRQYAVVGFIDDDASKHGLCVNGTPVLGGHECLPSVIRDRQVSEVILAINGEIQGATFQTLLDCQAQGTSIVQMLSLYEQITGYVPIDHLDADMVMAAYIDRWPRQGWYPAAERLLDIFGATVGLLLLGLMLPFIALVIWLEDHGPILIRQTRLGKGGRSFVMVKFRSMIPEAEADGQPRWAAPADGRITRVGKILRRSRLDEAPQFWNVLKGEMSLVGPRPERPEFVAELEKQIPFFRARLGVKPGITGWAQIHYGYSASVADAARKLQWDLYYIKHQSLGLDLFILARTAGVMLRFKGT